MIGEKRVYARDIVRIKSVEIAMGGDGIEIVKDNVK